MPDAVRVPKSACRRCGTVNDGASGLGGAPRRPTPGAVSFCAYCGTVSIFDDELHVRPPTDVEIQEMLTDRNLVAMLDRLMNAMGTALDEGVAMPCGCRVTWGEELFALVACAPDCVMAHRIVKMAADSGKPYSVI